MNRRYLLVFPLALLLCLFFVACQQVKKETLEPTSQDVTSETSLLFLGNKNIAPVVYLDGNTPSGVAIDIVIALAKHIKQPIEIRAMDWSEAQTLVANGEADALIQINPTEERRKIYDFSDPFLESEFSIFTSTEKIGISGLSSLRGLRVGVEKGGLPQQVLEKDNSILLIIIPNFIEGFKQINDGSIDAIVVDYRVGSYIIAENNIRNIKVTGSPITTSFSSIAVKKGNTELLNEINNALQIIKSDGTYQKILDKWKPTEVVFLTHEQITDKIYQGSLLIVLILFAITIAWVLVSRKEITRRKVSEEKVKDQYFTLRSIIDRENALIFSVDRKYLYTSFNSGHAAVMKKIYGAEIEIGHSILEYMTVTEDREKAKCNIDRSLADEQHVDEAYSGEEQRSRLFFQVTHCPIKNETGEVIGAAVLSYDVTERRLAEEKLRQSEEKYRILFEESFDGIFITSPTGKILDMNKKGIQMFGYDSKEEIMSLDLNQDIYTYLPDRKRILDMVNAQGTAEYEVSVKKKNGEQIVTFCALTAVKDARGVITSYRGIIHDITERKQAEEEITTLNQQLEQRVVDRTAQLEAANKELEAFAYSISHDLRAPLRHIDGFIEMLQNSSHNTLDKKSQNYMEIISESAKKMGILIDDLLSFSRMGRSEMFNSEIDLASLAQDVIKEYEPEAAGRDIRWKIAPLPIITGDQAMLRMVLTNLISNALKFTRSRKITRIEIGWEKGNDNEVVVFVRDNGVGFDMQYADKLFGVFQRLHRQEDFEGTGIGLANIRRIISRHGGRTWAEGKKNQGATFYFSLPTTK